MGAFVLAKVGFVFPSYYGNLPRAVRAFVEKIEIKPDTYIFAVVTMGAVGQGSVGALDKALKVKGLRLNYVRGVLMPANYVIKYNPANGDKKAKALDKADERLRVFAREISARIQSVKSLCAVSASCGRQGFSLCRDFRAEPCYIPPSC